MARDGLDDAASGVSMGVLTAGGTVERSISREAQDEAAALSHQRAAAAQTDGVFADEIAPLTIPQRKGAPLLLSQTSKCLLRWGHRPAAASSGRRVIRAFTASSRPGMRSRERAKKFTA